MQQVKEFILRHRWTILLCIIGVVIFILIFTINFWRTLLLCVVLGLCFLIGTLLDKGGIEMVKTFFNRFLPKK
ncbi:DUF2273 domain-containing protein [Christensenellaceae bacterium OttesenSCG-928-L17]|nr:DUF2273 domain-containing protein [Christensenellaceae bacterium OttesenSCG-928-L17]